MTLEVTVADLDAIAVPRVDRSVRPLRRSDVAAVTVAGGGVIAGEHASRPVLLDPVAWDLWKAMDGTARVDELAKDLAWATDTTVEAAGRQIRWLVTALAVDGFLEEPEPVTPVLPRRLNPNVPVESCLGRRLGLSRARVVQIADVHGEPFLAGCTEDSIIDQVVGDLAPTDNVGLGRELIFLRATVPKRGRERLQQVLDSLSNPLFVSRDLASATEAFGRSINARRHVSEGVWSEGVALQRAGRALAIHPAFRDVVTGPLRADLGHRGLTFVPSGLLRFDGTAGVTAVAVPALGFDERRWDFAGLLIPQVTSGSGSKLCAALPIARRWNQVHLEHFRAIVNAGLAAEHAAHGSADQLVAAIEVLLPER